MKKLKERWGVTSNLQLAVIFTVFAITGSGSAKLAGPFMEILGIDGSNISGWIYWPMRLILIFPIYQVLLVSIGWMFGQFNFFWEFEKKMLSKMGFTRFIK